MERHTAIVQADAVDEPQEIVFRIEDVIVGESDVRSGGLAELRELLVAALLVLGTTGDYLAAEPQEKTLHMDITRWPTPKSD